jgi:cytochrome bd-type quinol oxidase subunit 1
MNHRGGFRLRAGRVVDVHPWRALFANDFLWHELIHMYVAAYLVTGFVMAGVYAVARLRGRWTRYERTTIVVPLVIAELAAMSWPAATETCASRVRRRRRVQQLRLEAGLAAHVLVHAARLVMPRTRRRWRIA